MSVNFSRSDRSPVMPTGTEVAAYRTYQEAANAVDKLIGEGFKPSTISIVGSDLHLAERVIAKMSPGRVAAAGSLRGLTWGLLLALVVMLTSPEAPAVFLLLAVAAGMGGGTILSVVSWMASKGSKSFSAQAQLVATRYAILTAERTDRAYHLLERTPGNMARAHRRRQRARPADAGPTEFGSRPDEKPKFGVRLSDQERTDERHPHRDADHGAGDEGPGALGGQLSEAPPEQVAEQSAVPESTPDGSGEADRV